MATDWLYPILDYEPEGGVPGSSVSNPPVYSQNDVTQLVEGQAYVDVVFGSIQTTEDWVLVTCEVENTTDFEPLNIWPGIITDRTAAGFRVQLSGMPDSGNYYLHWAVSGVNITPFPATTYYLSVNAEMVFTVRLPPSTTVPATITITPDDGGAGGSFSPTYVTLTTASASATFTYTPSAYGDVTISTTNSSTLIDPASLVVSFIAPTYTLTGPSSGIISVASTDFTVELSGAASITVTPSDGGAGGMFAPTTVALSVGTPSATFTYTPSTYGGRTISVTNDGGLADPVNLTYTSLTSTYTLSGPSAGDVSVASTNFTVAIPGDVIGSVTVTPNDSSGGGVFAPTTVNLSTGAPSATFTYTPASIGTKTVGVTNSGGLTNPTGISYVVTAPFVPTDITGLKCWLKGDSAIWTGGTPTDGASIGAAKVWHDESGNSNDISGGTATYKTNILNSKPVLRFNGTTDVLLQAGSTGVSQPCTIFVVGKQTSKATQGRFLHTNSPMIIVLDTSGFLSLYAGSIITGATDYSGAFHVFTAIFSGGNGTGYVEGTSILGPGAVGANAIGQLALGSDSATNYLTGDIAEVLIYNSALGSTDRGNVETYLRAKYAI